MPKTATPPTARKPASPLLAADEIMALANAGRWDVLESRSRALAMRQPGQALGWKALGTALMQQGKFADAIAALARLVKIVPGDMGGHNTRALAQAATGRPVEAEASFRRAIRINPQYAGAHQNLGGLLSRLGRFDEALAHQRLGVAIEAPRGEAHLPGA